MRGLLPFFLAVAACSRIAGPEGGGTEPVKPTLQDVWQKVFVRQCAFSSCHSTEGHRSGLVLATSRNAKPTGDEFLAACVNLVNEPVQNPNTKGEIRVVPGDAQSSFLVKVLEGNIDRVPECSADEDCNCPMPLNGDCSTTMPADRILAIRQWIDALPTSGCVPPSDSGPDVGPSDGAALDGADAASD